jgi:hypothetical protein
MILFPARVLRIKKMIIKVELLEKGPRKTIILYDVHVVTKIALWRFLENAQIGTVIRNIKKLLSGGWDLCGEFPSIGTTEQHVYFLESLFEGKITELPTPERYVFKVCMVNNL